MSRKIELTQGKITIVDNFDYLWLSKYKWYFGGNYAVRNLSVKRGEVSTTYPRRSVFMHKEILNYYNLLLPNQIGDHINGDKLDNRKKNLRSVTYRQNTQNSKKQLQQGCHSEYKGVILENKDKWRSCIFNNGKKLTLGFFKNEIDAALAYDVAALYFYGEFARLNFPKNMNRNHIKVNHVNRIGWDRGNSKYRGVTKEGNNFRLQVYNKKILYLGMFSNELEAAKCYDKYIIQNKLNKKLNFEYKKDGRFILQKTS
jgi:hypothetical protein